MRNLNFIRRCSLQSLLILIVLVGSHKLFADSVEIKATNFSAGSGVAFLGLSPFNPALGTLDNVGVSISGQLQATVLTSPPPDGFGGFIPQPYLFSVSMNFAGLPNQAFFTFVNPAEYEFSGVAAVPGSTTFVVPFTFGFHLNSSTDLVGFAPVTSDAAIQPGLVSGTRAGFTSSFALFMDETLTLGPGNLQSSFATITGLSASGAVIVQYDYAPTAPPPAVPEPSSFVLLSTGLVGGVGALHRKLAK
jgi:hypothetical protein